MKKLYRMLAIFAMAFFLINLSLTYLGQKNTLKDLEGKKDAKESELVRVSEQVLDIESELDNVDNLDFVEKVAREKLNMVGPNDLVYVDKSSQDSESQEEGD